MTDREQQFDPPRIILVKEADGKFDFGLLPEGFRRFENHQMLCAGVVVRSQHGFELLTSERYMLPAGTSDSEMKNWQKRAIGFVHSQWRAYQANGFKLPNFPQEEAFNEMMSHSVRNLGTEIMTEREIDSLERTLHHAFMEMLDRAMGLPTRRGLSGRYSMGGHA
jgi:hypothetical protein